MSKVADVLNPTSQWERRIGPDATEARRRFINSWVAMAVWVCGNAALDIGLSPVISPLVGNRNLPNIIGLCYLALVLTASLALLLRMFRFQKVLVVKTYEALRLNMLAVKAGFNITTLYRISAFDDFVEKWHIPTYEIREQARLKARSSGNEPSE